MGIISILSCQSLQAKFPNLVGPFKGGVSSISLLRYWNNSINISTFSFDGPILFSLVVVVVVGSINDGNGIDPIRPGRVTISTFNIPGGIL